MKAIVTLSVAEKKYNKMIEFLLNENEELGSLFHKDKETEGSWNSIIMDEDEALSLSCDLNRYLKESGMRTDTYSTDILDEEYFEYYEIPMFFGEK